MSKAQILNDGPGRKKTILERLSSRRAMLVLGAVSLFLLIVAIGGVVSYLGKRSSQPPLKQPPASLSGLATQFPEISSVLQDEKLDSVYKQFFVEYQKGGEKAAFELARKRGILNANNEIRLTLARHNRYKRFAGQSGGAWCQGDRRKREFDGYCDPAGIGAGITGVRPAWRFIYPAFRSAAYHTFAFARDRDAR